MATGNYTGQAGGSVPLYAESELVQSTAATDFLTLTGAASQTGDFLVLRNSDKVEKVWVTSLGSVQFGETTVGQVAAGGVTMIYGRALQKTTALTGDVIGVRGNARITIASTSGSLFGGYFQAGTGSSATGADGVNVLKLAGLTAQVITAVGTATVGNAHGIDVVMDVNSATTAITTLMGIRVAIQTGSSQGTHTNDVGICIINEDVEGTGTEIDAGLAIGNISRAVGFTYLIDLNPSILDAANGTVVGCSGHNADIRFSNNAWLVALATAITANTTATTAPAGSLGFTTHATGNTKWFMSDGSKWQYAAVA